jgi:peptidoglycan/xylan/chitin deacetylase (PgdA/CDA1 family)
MSWQVCRQCCISARKSNLDYNNYMEKAHIKHRTISSLFARIPMSLLVRLNNPIIPYYHMISDDEKIHIKHLYAHKNIAMFEKDIEFFARKFSPISLYDLLGFLRGTNPLPKQCFLLTFDDGFKEMHDIVAPILIKKGIPATFFVNADFIDNRILCYQHKASILIEYCPWLRSPTLEKEINDLLKTNGHEINDVQSGILSIKYHQKNCLDTIAELVGIDFSEYLSKHEPYLTAAQIKSLMKSGFTIGAHSMDHPFYAALTLEEQLYQTTESMKLIKEKFSLKYSSFAFPHTDFGVSNRFFNALSMSGKVDVTFGTRGIIDDPIHNNFQRVSMEKPLLPAERIVAFQFARKLFKLLTRNNKIIRN